MSFKEECLLPKEDFTFFLLLSVEEVHKNLQHSIEVNSIIYLEHLYSILFQHRWPKAEKEIQFFFLNWMKMRQHIFISIWYQEKEKPSTSLYVHFVINDNLIIRLSFFFLHLLECYCNCALNKSSHTHSGRFLNAVSVVINSATFCLHGVYYVILN